MSAEAKPLQYTETLQKNSCKLNSSKRKQLHTVDNSDTEAMAIVTTWSKYKRVSCLVLWYPRTSQKTQKCSATEQIPILGNILVH